MATVAAGINGSRPIDSIFSLPTTRFLCASFPPLFCLVSLSWYFLFYSFLLMLVDRAECILSWLRQCWAIDSTSLSTLPATLDSSSNAPAPHPPPRRVYFVYPRRRFRHNFTMTSSHSSSFLQSCAWRSTALLSKVFMMVSSDTSNDTSRTLARAD